jgi:DNA-binding NtrC family response regulator
MQSLLLRFLETGEIQKVGAERAAIAPNVRVITATNRNLRELVTEGLFREDLFYRINVIHLVVPPLREHREDIPVLIEHFMKNFVTDRQDAPGGNGHSNGNGNGHAAETAVRGITPEAIEALSQYSWPGNVRQLENAIERLVVTGRQEMITVDDLPMEVRSPLQTGVRSRRERRRTIAEDLFKKLTNDQESFWTAVYPLYMNREITRGNVRDLVHKGLEEARGNYKIVMRLFNMEAGDYKRFLNFLRKHDCQLPFKEYRQ